MTITIHGIVFDVSDPGKGIAGEGIVVTLPKGFRDGVVQILGYGMITRLENLGLRPATALHAAAA